MKEHLITATMLVGLFGLWMAAGVHREAPLVGHGKLGAQIGQLEEQVARTPRDAQRLTELAKLYVERGSPGLAIAAIRKAPLEVQDDPTVSHQFAVALLHEGKASAALERERQAVRGCAARACAPWMLASALRHQDFLEAMVAQGVEDYRKDPGATAYAYQRLQLSSVAVLDARLASP